MLFLAPLFILGSGFEILLQKIPNDYSYKKNYLDNNSKFIKVLFLGNSHSYCGINPEHITGKSFSAAYFSQSLNYDLEILKKYENELDSLKFIVLPVSYVSLYSKLENSIEAWRVKNYTLYYGINTRYNFTDYFEILNSSLKNNSKKAYDFIFKNKTGVSCSALGWGKMPTSDDVRHLESSGIEAASRHTAKDERYLAELVQAIHSIIKIAEQKKAKVLLLTLPAYDRYVKSLDAYQLKKTVSILKKLDDSYHHVAYLNLLSDSGFGSSDFFDADHLSENGSKKLTIKINSVISLLANTASN